MKLYECIENGEFFTIQAYDMSDARDQACLWGAEVIRELKN